MRHAEQPQEGPLDRSNRAESVEFGRSVDLFGIMARVSSAPGVALESGKHGEVLRAAGSLLGAHDVIEGGHPHGYGPDRYRRGMLDEVVVTASAGWGKRQVEVTVAAGEVESATPQGGGVLGERQPSGNVSRPDTSPSAGERRAC